MPRFEIACVTMHQKDFSKIQEMNIHSDVIFANQCDRTAYEEIAFEGHTARMISTETRGVGNNRNLALTYAKGDILLLQMMCDMLTIWRKLFSENLIRIRMQTCSFSI